MANEKRFEDDVIPSCWTAIAETKHEIGIRPSAEKVSGSFLLEKQPAQRYLTTTSCL